MMNPVDETEALGKTSVSSQPKLPSADSGQIPLPPAIGPYRLEQILGRGGMAAVYLCHEQGSDRQVALKLMDPALGSDDDFVQRFLGEAKAVEGLRHPHIVETFAWGESDGWRYLATEYVEGGTVYGVLKQMGRLPVPVALELFVQLLGGLQAAHQHGIVHRDLKPENLLLTWGGILKIGDFGIARTSDNQKLTKTGMLLGTVGYMSPEQARGEKVDLRSDLFACGTILFEFLSGRSPFLSESSATSLIKILSSERPLLFEEIPWITPQVETIIERCWQAERTQRFQSADEVLNAVLPLVAATRVQRPTLVSEALRYPKEMRAQSERETSLTLTSEAEQILKHAGRVEKNRAAMKLMSACALDSVNERAHQLLASLSQELGLHSGAGENRKILELEAALPKTNVQPGQLQHLANLYKLEGNLFKSAVYLRKYLRLRPQDTIAQNQYFQVTGEKVNETGLVQMGPVTRELIAGIKTGGFKAKTSSRQMTQLEKAEVLAGPQDANEGIRNLADTSGGSSVRQLLKWAASLAAVGVALMLLGRLFSSGFDRLVASAQPKSSGQPIVKINNLVIPTEQEARIDLKLESLGPIKDKLDEAERLSNEAPETALMYIDSIAEKMPTPEIRRRLELLRGLSLQRLGRHSLAIDVFQSLIDPKNSDHISDESLAARGESKAASADDEGALNDFDAFLHNEPAHMWRAKVLIQRGKILQKKGDNLTAMDSFRRAVQAAKIGSPEAAEAQMFLGQF
jgi:serine/threonine protein kinase